MDLKTLFGGGGSDTGKRTATFDPEKDKAVRASNTLIYRGGPYTEQELMQIEVFSPEYADRNRRTQAVSGLKQGLGTSTQGIPAPQFETPVGIPKSVEPERYPADVDTEQHYRKFMDETVLSGDSEKIKRAREVARSVAGVYGHKIPAFLAEEETGAPILKSASEGPQNLFNKTTGRFAPVPGTEDWQAPPASAVGKTIQDLQSILGRSLTTSEVEKVGGLREGDEWKDVGNKIIVARLNPKTQKYDTVQSFNKGAAPGQSKALTEEDYQEIFVKYNIARLKGATDPERIMLMDAFKSMGITIDPTMPQLPYKEFKKIITTGYGTPKAVKASVHKVGDIVTKGGKKWKVTGMDADGEPLVIPTR